MKQNMTVSGTHKGDQRTFVKSAMVGFSGFAKISVYYYFMQCDFNYDIDSNFQPFLDVLLKGDC
jgi:hypothetical protein